MVILSKDNHPKKPDSMKISNPGFLILSEIIDIILQPTFCEISTLRWIRSLLGEIFAFKKICAI